MLFRSLPYKPKVVVVYEGDNDIASGKSPEQVLADFKKLAAMVHSKLPRTKILYVSIKASLSRWKLAAEIRKANALIEDFAKGDKRLGYINVFNSMLGPDGRPRADLLLSDELHPSPACYQLWTRLIRPEVEKALRAPDAQKGFRRGVESR